MANKEKSKTYDFKLGNEMVKAKIFEEGDETGYTLVKIPNGGTVEVPYVLNSNGNMLVADKGFGRYFLVLGEPLRLIDKEDFEVSAGMKKAFTKNIFDGYASIDLLDGTDTDYKFLNISLESITQLYMDLGIKCYDGKFNDIEGKTQPIAILSRKGSEIKLIFNSKVLDKNLRKYAGAYLLYDVVEGNVPDESEVCYYASPLLDNIRNKTFVMKQLRLSENYKTAKKYVKDYDEDDTVDQIAEYLELPTNVVLELRLLIDK